MLPWDYAGSISTRKSRNLQYIRIRRLLLILTKIVRVYEFRSLKGEYRCIQIVLGRSDSTTICSIVADDNGKSGRLKCSKNVLY